MFRKIEKFEVVLGILVALGGAAVVTWLVNQIAEFLFGSVELSWETTALIYGAVFTVLIVVLSILAIAVAKIYTVLWPKEKPTLGIKPLDLVIGIIDPPDTRGGNNYRSLVTLNLRLWSNPNSYIVDWQLFIVTAAKVYGGVAKKSDIPVIVDGHQYLPDGSTLTGEDIPEIGTAPKTGTVTFVSNAPNSEILDSKIKLIATSSDGRREEIEFNGWDL